MNTTRLFCPRCFKTRGKIQCLPSKFFRDWVPYHESNTNRQKYSAQDTYTRHVVQPNQDLACKSLQGYYCEGLPGRAITVCSKADLKVIISVLRFNWEEEGDVRELSIFLTYGTKLSAQSQHYVARKTQQGNMENDSLIIHLIRVYISSVLYKPTGWCA